MRILVAIPSLSIDIFDNTEIDCFIEKGSFRPKGRNLDVFYDELDDIKINKLFGINIPNWSFSEKGGEGVSGPGKDDVWFPPELKDRLAARAGVYDQWRPYPASYPISSYSINIAKRFSRKRYRMFETISDEMSWDTLFYVEHSPSSLAHISKKHAYEIGTNIIKSVIKVSSSMPFVDVVIFSPYGIGKKSGFVVSNRIEAKDLNSWKNIREYLQGNI